ncbi:EAL domain-containing protein [Acuticoccus sp. I52.16.1]|uniref:EAL domain-containing protein n=1 Tax=Acuticoccus sp. I52.16.1 TaxID=2928472 RepID=UPI001FD409CE|nr:EAL domain-containing protein [Acuticoccus sp. I52.16.1]UOM35505.1 EAL domain-containing protein [Acuticoccus sp. I52.16.1]
MPRDYCRQCQPDDGLGFEFTFAFQPIVNVMTREVYAYEALVRGPQGEGAETVLSQLDTTNRYQFDQEARVSAIRLASALFGKTDAKLSLNIMPNAVYDPVRCLRATLRAAKEYDFPLTRLMFEFTEHERVADVAHLRRIARHYASCGFITAIDDFGAGFAGLRFLAEFVPNVVKIDRHLVRELQHDRVRQAIINAILTVARDLDITIVAEGIETADEYGFLVDMGVELFQGYYFARPAFEQVPAVSFGGPITLGVNTYAGTVPSAT